VELAIEILVLAIGAIAMLIVLPTVPKRRRRVSRARRRSGPEDLERLEQLVVTGRASAGEVHVRLRPLLAEIAAARLARQRVLLDRDPDRARAFLGDELWELVRLDRPRPEDPRGPGISLERLAAMTDRLERL
jgi:hypothetical protein